MIFNVCLCHFGSGDEEIAYERATENNKKRKITGRRVMNAEKKPTGANRTEESRTWQRQQTEIRSKKTMKTRKSSSSK